MVPDTDVINIIEEMSTKSSALEHDTASSNVREEEFQSSLSSLKEKISRTAQFLQDLKLLSQEIQDLEGDQEDKDKQIFTRRIGKFMSWRNQNENISFNRGTTFIL